MGNPGSVYTLMEGMEYYGVLNEVYTLGFMYNPIQKPYNLNIIDTDARILLMAENRKNLAGSFILAVDATRLSVQDQVILDSAGEAVTTPSRFRKGKGDSRRINLSISIKRDDL
jgi:hypothetical protein